MWFLHWVDIHNIYIDGGAPVLLGSPPAADVDITSLHAKNPQDLWKKVYERVFPQEVVQALETLFLHFIFLNIIYINNKFMMHLTDFAENQ